MSSLGKTAPDASPRRGWFSRNWRWFVPVCVLLVIVLAGVAVWFNMLGKNRLYKHSEPYQYALKQVQRDSKVIERLGEPIHDATGVPSGTIDESNGRGNASLMFRVAGPKAEADVRTDARRRDGPWETTRIEVTFADDTRLSVDPGQGPGDDAPAFNPKGGGEAPKFNPKGGGEAPKWSPGGGSTPGIQIDLPGAQNSSKLKK